MEGPPLTCYITRRPSAFYHETGGDVRRDAAGRQVLPPGGGREVTVSFCATGRVVSVPPWAVLASGATHALQDERGETLFLLRSRMLTLDRLLGKIGRVCGRRRGQVIGEPAPVLEVTDMLDLTRLPPRPGFNRLEPGSCLSCDVLSVRSLLRR